MKRTCQLLQLLTALAASSLTVNAGFAQNPGSDRAAQRIAEQSEVSALNARLQRERPDTFAGLWIEKSPELKVVVRFTGDAKGQLAPFTKDPRYVAETAPRSLELLLATQQEMMHQLSAAGINFEAGVDIKRSEITLYVLDTQTARDTLAGLLSSVDFIRIEKTTGFIQTTAVSGGPLLDGVGTDR